MDYLDSLKRAYKANGGSGICAMATQLVCENPSYYTDLKNAGQVDLYPVLECCYRLNIETWRVSKKRITPLQKVKVLVEQLEDTKVWPYQPEKRFEFMQYGVHYALSLHMKWFYKEQRRLGDNARFGTTTVTALKKLRQLMLANPIAKDLADELTHYMLITKLTK